MKTKNKHTGKFKSKGSDILNIKMAGPSSMNEFLKDQPEKNTQLHKDTVVQLHKTTEPQDHALTNVQRRNGIKAQIAIDENKDSETKNAESEAVERIHVQIRKDLADKLIEMVYSRKREGKLAKRKASQRHIIEQALEEYFAK